MSYSYLVIGVLLVFGALGFWRGWLREIGTLAGLLVAWLVLVSAGETFVGITNRLWLIAAFTLRDGYDSPAPGALIQSLRERAPLDPRHPDFFLGIIFALLAVIVFIAANRFVARATTWSSQALGTLVGLANGYLLAYLGFHYFAPSARVNLAVSMNPADVADALGRYLPTVLVAGVVVAIGIALVSSRRITSRGSARPTPGRSRG